MSVKEMTKEEALDEIGKQIAESFFGWMHGYQGAEMEIAQMIGMGLAQFIAIKAKAPQHALTTCARMIENFDYGTTRGQYYGYMTLGVKDSQSVPEPAPVVNIGDPRFKR